MKRFIMMCAGISLVSSLMAVPAEFTFFGDSLSDTGNFPEPASIEQPSLKNFNLYVPITNPVVLNSQDPMQHFLMQSLGPVSKQGLINGSSRAQWSINWPLYLVYQLTPTQPLLARFSPTYVAGQSLNINYAVAAAIAGNANGDPEAMGECFHLGGSAFYGDCTVATMANNRQTYEKQTAEDPHYDQKTNNRTKAVQVPDLNKQISIFLDDQQGKMPANNALFIYIGANDIGDFLKPLVLDMALESESDFIVKRVTPQMQITANYVKQAVSRLEHAYGTRSDYRIYILTLPHFSHLHQAYEYAHIPLFGALFGAKLLRILDQSVDLYNNDLKQIMAHDSHVSVVDSGAQLDKLAASSVYQQAIKEGQACAQDQAYLTASANHTHDCQVQIGTRLNTTTYFSWNDLHYTAPVNASLAHFLATTLFA